MNSTPLFSIYVLFIFFTTLHADPELDRLMSMSFEELLNVEINGVTLTSEKNRDVPAAVSVFKRRQIAQMGIDSLDELMAYVPGFQSYRMDEHGLFYSYSSRGRRTSSSSAEVLIIVDGIKLNDGRKGGAVSVIPKFPLEWIERVEFIRGGGSALYGSNAMQGIVNIITVKKTNALELAGGSYDRFKGVLLGTYNEEALHLDLLSSYDHSSGENYTRNDTFDRTVPYSQVQTDDPYDIANIYSSVNYKNTTFSYLRSTTNVEDFYTLGNISNNINSSEITNDIFALEYSEVFGALKSTVILQYSQYNTDISTQLSAQGALAPVSSPSSTQAGLANTRLDSSEYRGIIDNDYTINADNSVQFGAEYRRIISPTLYASSNFDLAAYAQEAFPISSSQNMDIPTEIEKADTQEIFAFYAQYQAKILEDLSLTLGARYDDYKGLDTQLSYKTAAVYQINNTQTLKAIYAKSFRAPTTNELYLVNNPFRTGNPNLASENIQNIDLIWMGSFEQTAIWSLGYFENHYDNAIIEIQNLSKQGSIFENMDQDPVKGFELELQYKPSSEWMFRGTYTHFTELPSLSYQESSQLLSLIGNYHYEKLNINLSGVYNGSRAYAVDDDRNQFTLASYWLVDTKISYQLYPTLNLFLQGKNILDKTYTTPTQTRISTDGVANRGIEGLAGIIWNF